jgi:Putative lumazine-binding
MKKLSPLFLFSILLLHEAALFAQSDEEAVKQVVTSAYIEGIQNRGDVAAIRKGFHPSFNMLRLTDNNIAPLPIEEWITNLEKSKAQNTPFAKTTGKFINVDVTGNAAVVKLELYREEKKVFTDYIVLYKFTEGWRIVSKTYFRH